MFVRKIIAPEITLSSQDFEAVFVHKRIVKNYDRYPSSQAEARISFCHSYILLLFLIMHMVETPSTIRFCGCCRLQEVPTF